MYWVTRERQNRRLKIKNKKSIRMFMFGNGEKMKIKIAKPCIQSTFCEASLREYFNNTDKCALFSLSYWSLVSIRCIDAGLHV